MKQNIEIEVPDGFEAKYDPETMQIKIIKKDDKPRSWEEYLVQNPNANGKYWYVNSGSRVMYFSSSEECNAFTALAKLRQLREAWIGDWKPNFTMSRYVYSINRFNDEVQFRAFKDSFSSPLTFPTEEMANEFMNCFKDLLEIAKPLI